MADRTSSCALCGTGISEFKYKPMKDWGVTGLLCSQCYEKKLMEHYIAPDRRHITKK